MQAGLPASPRSVAAVQMVGEEWAVTISQSLGISATSAGALVRYLLEHYPIPFIVGAILVTGALLKTIYERYAGGAQVGAGNGAVHGKGRKKSRKNRRKGKKNQGDAQATPRAEDDDVEVIEQEVGAQAADREEDDEELESEESTPVQPASSSDSGEGAKEDTSDFYWWGGKAQRNPKIPMTPYRQAAWNDFCNNKPKAKKGKRKPKLDPGRAIFESKKKAAAAVIAGIPEAPVSDPYVRVELDAPLAFFVDTTKQARAGKSSSLGGNQGTKPLAIVYGRYSTMSAQEGIEAEVHVHFDDDNPIDSHTGAHVKIGETYPFDWDRGRASAQPTLRGILNAGFGNNRWQRRDSYLT